MTKIYGASDDLIEIEGEIEEEYGMGETGVSFSCSDGTSGKINYDGNWMITIKTTGSLFKKIVNGSPAEEPHTDEDAKGCSPYSDVLILNDGIEWVKISRKTFKK